MVTVGVRNYRPRPSGDLAVAVLRVPKRGEPGWLWGPSPRYTYPAVSDWVLLDSVRAYSALETKSYAIKLNVPDYVTGLSQLVIRLSDAGEDGILFSDDVYLEDLVDLSAPEFEVGGFDYLVDTDEDGVGDLNEELAGTAPLDPLSVPGDTEIDVVAPYDNAYAELFEGDPYTRIRHVMTLAEEIFQRSDTGIRLRLVGIPPYGVGDPLDEYAADIRVDFLGDTKGGRCGGAGLPGGSRGHIPSYARARYAVVKSVCAGGVAAHEIGHVMGLGHSYLQNQTGIWRWSRGHYYGYEKGTIMSYGNYGRSLPRFSDPDVDCDGGPCGVERSELQGADAVASLNAVRFQIGRYAEGKPDTDSDSFIDERDDFPRDPMEWRDTDGDGVGDVADTDDDGDGVSDDVDVFPFDPSENADSDDDGVGDNADAFPTDPEETEDTDGDGVGDNGDVYPNDPNESRDTDGDGVGDNGDLFPEDPYEWSDADGDGVGDNADSDADGDGVPNALDLFPADPAKTDLSSYLIRAEQAGDRVGRGPLGAADMNHDGTPDFVIGATFHQGRGAIYVVSGAHLGAADVADGARDRVVDLRHMLAQPDSWKFLGHSNNPYHYLGWGEAVAVGDWNGDGRADMAIAGVLLKRGAEVKRVPAVYIIDGTSLANLDAADGIIDSVIDLRYVAAITGYGRFDREIDPSRVADNTGSWLLLGREYGRYVDVGVAIARDIDGSGQPHVVVGLSAYGGERRREVLVIPSGGLPAADATDGEVDGVVHIEDVDHWRLVDDDAGEDIPGATVTTGDFDGDGVDEIILGGSRYGRVARRHHVISGHRLPDADLSDGEADGLVELSRVADGVGSWKLVDEWRYVCCERWATVHVNADGSRSLLLGDETRSYILSNADIWRADAADGVADGTVLLANVSIEPNSFELRSPVRSLGDLDEDGIRDFALFEGSNSRVIRFGPVADDAETDYWALIIGPAREPGTSASSAGDVDGDGLSDVLVGRPGRSGVGEVLLLMGADFAALDRADGVSDRTLLMSNLTLDDPDHDGLANTVDLDDDNDGVGDALDDFPLDPDEWKDSDGDGVGNNSDAFPRDGNESRDTDGDGVGNTADRDDDNDGIPDGEDDHPHDTDNDGLDNWDDPDDDNDGVADADDELPLNPWETRDTDGDGIGNNADSDDDGDGVEDGADDLPLDPSETQDTDGDGVGDNSDAYPNDATEWVDTDGDGSGDNADPDDDNDGVLDSSDAFPLDPDESADTDGDGVGNNADLFPRDATETMDFDGDGIGDNGDMDDDNDGVSDTDDLFPRNRAKSALTSYELTSEKNAPLGIRQIMSSEDDHTLMMGIGGSVYAIAVNQMPAADALDGNLDGHISIDRMLELRGSWKVTGGSGGYLASTDIYGDGRADLWITKTTGARGAPLHNFVIFAEILASAGNADDMAGRVIDLDAVVGPRVVRFGLVDSGQAALVTYGLPTMLGDLDGDGLTDFSLSRPSILGGGYPGTARVAFATALRDGEATFGLEGEYVDDRAGTSVASAGNSHILVGAPGHDVLLGDEGAVYIVPIAEFLSRDYASYGLDRVANMDGGYKLLGDSTRSSIGYRSSLSANDIDGDGLTDGLIERFAGRHSLVTGASLSIADRLDGIPDGVVAIQNVVGLLGNFEFAGEDRDGYSLRGFASSIVDDLDLDDVPDLLFEVQQPVDWSQQRSHLHRLYVVSGAELGAADAADGELDGRIALADLGQQPGTWMLDLGRRISLFAAKEVGDLDGDGVPDLAIAAESAFFISGADLPLLDAADGVEDRVVDLSILSILRSDD